MAQFLTNEQYGNGGDGAITYTSSGVDTTPNTTATGTSGTTALTVGSGTGFAANNIVLIHQSQSTGVGVWELNVISSVGGGTNWTMKYALSNTYGTGAQVYLLKQYSAFTINSGVTVTGLANNDTQGGIFAVLCNGPVTIAGTITVTGKGFRGASATSAGDGWTGSGTVGAGVNQRTANGNGGGGGGVKAAPGYPSGGGGGGNGAAGTQGQTKDSTAGDGGNTSGAANLTTMTFGGGGGKGGNNTVLGDDAGAGGIGGGAVFIFGRTVTVTGAITANGNVGSAPNLTDCGGGGGGAGGSVLIKTQTGTLGSSLITATAGGGGASGGNGGNGGAGGTGRIHIDYSSSFSGTTNPTLTSTVDSTLSTLQFGSII